MPAFQRVAPCAITGVTRCQFLLGAAVVVYSPVHVVGRVLKVPSLLLGGSRRGRSVTPALIEAVDQVWVSAHHPTAGWELLRGAKRLPPHEAADYLLEQMPLVEQDASLALRLSCIGIALGSLSPSYQAHENARSIWRSTLPVMLVRPRPRRNASLQRELAEQVGYLVYDSVEGSERRRQVHDFADEFERAFAGV